MLSEKDKFISILTTSNKDGEKRGNIPIDLVIVLDKSGSMNCGMNEKS